MWSLATEQKKGIDALSSNVATPQAIDPNYLPGFVWTRQFGFRAVKNYKKAAFGMAAENPQLLYSTALAADTPYAVTRWSWRERRQLQCRQRTIARRRPCC